MQESREENSRISWLARTVSTFVAAGYFSEDNKKAIEEAESITFDPIEKAIREEAASFSASGKAKAPAVENKVGSYEALMRLAKQTRD